MYVVKTFDGKMRSFHFTRKGAKAKMGMMKESPYCTYYDTEKWILLIIVFASIGVMLAWRG